ncbi:ribonuclease H-like domain-containing protein [Tanacetum coccineum]
MQPTPEHQPIIEPILVHQQPAPIPSNTHPMVTRAKDGISKPIDHLCLHATTTSPISRSHTLALRNPFWQKAMHKFNTDGSLSRYKARLVVNGRKIVFMHQPPGFVDPRHPDYVCHLQRSLYGLKQAPRAWFQHFASYATRVGFQHSKTDLFIFLRGTDIAYFFYVDDIILTASSTAFLKRVISSLHGEFSMTDLGSLKLFSWCFCSTFYCRHHATNKSEPNNDDHASNVGCFPTLFKKIHPTSSSTVTASGSSTGSSQ